MNSDHDMERVVVLTPAGIGVEARDRVHRTGMSHMCAHLLCTNHDKIYLQRRKKNRHRNPDCWTSTVSGHITLADAKVNGQVSADEEAGRHALAHEVLEELGYGLPLSDAQFLGTVAAPSMGGGEICNCTALIFTLNYDRLIERVCTAEVEELASFPVSEVEMAVRLHGALVGNDERTHQLADNFAPVFNCFLAFWQTHGRG
jgi:isopentenyldiphosphate isomerase